MVTPRMTRGRGWGRWEGSPGFYAFLYFTEGYLAGSDELLKIPTDSNASLKPKMTDKEFFKFFYEGEPKTRPRGIGGKKAGGMNPRVFMNYHGRRAVKAGFSPRALYDLIQDVKNIEWDRNKMFFDDLAHYMRYYVPDWGEEKLGSPRLPSSESFDPLYTTDHEKVT